MAKKVGGLKEEEKQEPAIGINVSQPSDVAEITTITEKEHPAAAVPSNPDGQTSITAQELLDKSESELEKLGVGKREANNIAQTFRIITAILLGKNRNKELAQTLQTDKSFVAKQVKELEERGLVKKEEDGREVRYVADQFNILKFLQSKVVITSKKEAEVKEGGKNV
ncbi:MAG: winged helix-turn-helix transcriptional regulator [DPANN group archaeon]|nr:winged helix-turn-helix transcriptional regulator [DPANN group archaeon]